MITRRANDLMRFIAGYQEKHGGISPSFSECVAALAFKSKSTVGWYLLELERGSVSNPTIRAVWSIAGALGVAPAYLIGLDDSTSDLDPLALKLAAIINAELNKRFGGNHE